MLLTFFESFFFFFSNTNRYRVPTLLFFIVPFLFYFIKQDNSNMPAAQKSTSFEISLSEFKTAKSPESVRRKFTNPSNLSKQNSLRLLLPSLPPHPSFFFFFFFATIGDSTMDRSFSLKRTCSLMLYFLNSFFTFLLLFFFWIQI